MGACVKLLTAAAIIGITSISCSHRPATIDDYVVEARERNLLFQPSLKKATDTYLEDFRSRAVRNALQPVVRVAQCGQYTQDYTSPDAKKTVSLSQTRYCVRVEQVIHEYTTSGIHSVTHTGSYDRPFRGVAHIGVTTLTRKVSDFYFDLPLPPEGFKVSRATTARSSSPQFGRSTKGLPVSPVPTPVPQGTPDKVLKRIAGAVRKCASLEPVKSSMTYSISFDYGAVDRVWVLAEPPESITK